MIDPRTARRLSTSVRSSLRGVRATPLVFSASVCVMGAGLLLLGVFLLVVHNMQGVIDHLGSGLRVTAFMRADAVLEGDELEALSSRLRALDHVENVAYVSPEQALERLRRDLGQESAVLDGLSRNPLPGSFELELAANGRADPESVRALATAVASEPALEEVRYGEGWIEGYARVLRSVEWAGAVFGGFLIVVLGAIVAATVRLAVHARADEIQIQRLVGAGGVFVRLPFYLEGALQGGLAGGLALALLYALYALGLPALRAPLVFLLGSAEPAFLGPAQAVLLVAIGVLLGLGGALVSLLRLEGSP